MSDGVLVALDENEAVVELTAAMREADRAFEKVGGSTRHHVRDCLLPELEKMGLVLCRETVTPWVRADDRLPEAHTTVIVLRRGHFEPIAAQLDDDGEWMDAATHEIRRVTHWLPLPIRPEGS